MTQIRENSKMSEDFFRCRPQIVRFCRSLTGDADAAEDLAQETLAEAWRCRDKQQDPDKTEAWLFGIARNVCRRHFRRAAQTHERAAREVAATDDVWDRRARQEQAALIKRALDCLPDAPRSLLTARYFDGQTIGEVAAQSQSSENTAAVRLGRARDALRAVLSTQLRSETTALGLLADTPFWRPTRVWCFRCGAKYLEERRDSCGFQVRCPACDGEKGSVIAFSTGHAAMDPALVLGQVQSCKPALRRINAWWDTRLQQGLIAGTLSCWRCASPMTRTVPPPGDLPSRLSWHCKQCEAEFSLPASGLAFHSAAVQHFWQQNPRMRVRPEQRIEIGRSPALVTRYEAIGSTATIESVYDAQTFRRIG